QESALFFRERTREQHVSTPRCLDLVLLREDICFSNPGEDCVGLFSLDRPFWKTGPQFVGQRLRTQPDALVGYQPRGGLVHQEAMLDALHSRRNGSLNRLGRKSVG